MTPAAARIAPRPVRLPRAWPGLAALAVAFATAHPFPALASPVHVTAGSGKGQGTTFRIGADCYALTAAHVAGAKGARVEVANLEAYVATATVMAVDTGLDAALLKFEGQRTGEHKACGAAPLTLLALRDGAIVKPEVRSWLEQIPGPGGGFERTELLSRWAIDAERTFSSRQLASDQGPLQAGSSGAAVLADRASIGRQSSPARNRAPRISRPQRGEMLGMHLGIRNGRPFAVHAGDLAEFIGQALSPVDWSRFEFAGDAPFRLVERRYGIPHGDAGSVIRQVPGAAGLWFLIDLGARDAYVAGVRFEFSPSPGRQLPSTSILTSQFRPDSEGGKAWQRASCQREADRRPTRAVGIIECRFAAVRNTRGLKLAFGGEPALLKRFEILLDD